VADPKQIADALAQDQLLAQFNRNEGQAQPWYMKPMDMEGRATFLPFKDTLPGSVMNQRELALPGLLAGAVNAFTAPSRVSTQGFDAPEEALNLATNVFGGGITTGKMMRNPTGVGGTDLALNVYHGTPYEIQGKFDLAKVGTGEGAQAYGHGMYFGEARGTGEQYQKTLKHKGFNFANEETALGIKLPASAKGQFMQLAQRYPDDPMQAAGWVQSGNIEAREIPKEKIAELFKAYQEKTQGNLYKVDIPDEQIPMMLDWDKPLNQQSDAVKQGLMKLGITVDEKAYKSSLDDLEAALLGKTNKDVKDVPNPSGENIYNKLVAKFGLPEKASAELNKLGISGIRYLDEQSRGNFKAYTTYKGKKYGDEISFKTQKQLDDYIAQKKEEGFGVNVLPKTSNFVVFKPETVKILEKNDKPVSRKELLQQEFDKLDK